MLCRVAHFIRRLAVLDPTLRVLDVQLRFGAGADVLEVLTDIRSLRNFHGIVGTEHENHGRLRKSCDGDDLNENDLGCAVTYISQKVKVEINFCLYEFAHEAGRWRRYLVLLCL